MSPVPKPERIELADLREERARLWRMVGMLKGLTVAYADTEPLKPMVAHLHDAIRTIEAYVAVIEKKMHQLERA